MNFTDSLGLCSGPHIGFLGLPGFAYDFASVLAFGLYEWTALELAGTTFLLLGPVSWAIIGTALLLVGIEDELVNCG